MKSLGKLSAALIIVAASCSAAYAEVCSGTVDVSDINLGCDSEMTKNISLATCDFASGKIPNVDIPSVIDGRGSDTSSVTVGETRPGSFTVTLRPLPNTDRGGGVCKIQTFDWTAQ
jgi:hypothetical protein